MASTKKQVDIKLAVLGGGPVGIETAVAAVQRGMTVTLYEKGAGVAQNIREWGHVVLFSNNAYNHSKWGLEALPEFAKSRDTDAFPLGAQYVKEYLEPLAEYLKKSGKCTLKLGTEVVTCGRGNMLKTQVFNRTGNFRILSRNVETGKEELIEGYEAVVDATGSYGRGNMFGQGGVPALGETSLRASGRIRAKIPDVLGRHKADFENKATLVIGAGASAITTLNNLKQVGGATVYWITRKAPGKAPYTIIEDDPLPQRQRLYSLGNELALGEGDSRSGFKDFIYLGGSVITSVEEEKDQLNVELRKHDGAMETIKLDQLISHVGYRPDFEIVRELQVHYCYASEGPMKLAASLLAGDGSNDCLKQSAPGPELLKNPEKGMFTLGMKSYGRGSRFLLRVGHEQVDAIMKILCGEVPPPEETKPAEPEETEAEQTCADGGSMSSCAIQ